MAGRENREKWKGAYGVAGASKKKKKNFLSTRNLRIQMVWKQTLSFSVTRLTLTSDNSSRKWELVGVTLHITVWARPMTVHAAVRRIPTCASQKNKRSLKKGCYHSAIVRITSFSFCSYHPPILLGFRYLITCTPVGNGTKGGCCMIYHGVTRTNSNSLRIGKR